MPARAFLLSLALCAAIAASPFTLEQVTSAPFPSDLAAAPNGGRIAWVLNERGARNIWAASAPDYKGRRVTDYRDDDGQDLGQLHWTPDGRIVYVRGGDFERLGDEPNPRSNPEGVEQAIWIVAQGGKPQRLAEGDAPAVSPQGDRVACILKNQVWIAMTDGTGKPAQLIHSRGKARELRWSPDGSRLAFENSRGDHSLIGVYEFASKSLRYLDPGVDLDSNAEWSPDGGRIAFLRVPASRELIVFGPKRTAAEPWSIRIADASTGAGVQVWKARTGPGSAFHSIAADHQLFWGAGDRIVFPWERDGWAHLYSVAARGGEAAALTPGDFEVEHASLTPDRAEVLFSSNQGDIDRRHLWRVGVAGGPPRAITVGKGIEWSPVMTADREAIAFLRSDARRQARAAIQTGAAAKDLAPESIPADFPEASLVEPEPVMITAADGMQIHGQLFHPRGEGGRHPAVIFFHGGSRRQMLLGWHYRPYYNNAYAMNQYLASRGYVVLSVNYRSGIGYGLDFREALNYGATGASEFNDVLGAGLYLRSRPDVDPARIGLWGGSYGGYLTALGLARASDLFAAGVDIHGVHDWNTEIRIWAPTYDPQKQQEAARLAFESSPMAYVKQWRSPVLLIQGDDDRNVPFSEMVTMVEALRKQGVDFEQIVFPDEIHDFLAHSTWLRAYHAAADFFDRRLRKAR